MSLPKDDKARKALPIFTGVLAYFPDALLEVAKVSMIGNAQHNPGEPLHWARGKSMDQFNTALRHMMDAEIYHEAVNEAPPEVLAMLGFDEGPMHLANAAWRILAALQLAIEERRKQKADAERVLVSRRAQPAPTEAHGSMRVADLKNNPRSVDLHGAHPEFDTAHHPV